MTDSVTVAVQVPVYLTPPDIWHPSEDLGSHMPLPTTATLTVYIDVLQIGHGAIAPPAGSASASGFLQKHLPDIPS